MAAGLPVADRAHLRHIYLLPSEAPSEDQSPQTCLALAGALQKHCKRDDTAKVVSEVRSVNLLDTAICIVQPDVGPDAQ